MSTVEAETVVNVPVRVAYDRWTQFEDFPDFLPGVDQVTQISDDTLHWVVSPAGVTREYDAVITEQTPDEVIAWKSTDAPLNSGRVTFESNADETTRVTLKLEWEPEGFVEKAGAAMMVDDAFAKTDLAKFKDYVEEHAPVDGWLGEIPGHS